MCLFSLCACGSDTAQQETEVEVDVVPETVITSCLDADNTCKYVDGTSGADTNSCLTPEDACKSIQRGVEVTQGGDTLIVSSGVYYETPELRNLSSSESQPIWIRASSPGTVTISGMWEAAARGSVNWQHEGNDVYSSEHTPSLFASYNGVFLFRFLSYQDLIDQSATTPYETIALPDYGFAFENGRLYVRLPDRVDPNGQSVLFSSPTYTQEGETPVIRIVESPYVILDGFNIEGSGTFCVAIDQASVAPTIRNSKFSHCRYGMQLPDNSLVEWSEYTYPGFTQFAELTGELNGEIKVFELLKNYHDGTLEGGLADTYGPGGTSKNCEFRYNYLHEAFDGGSLGDFEYSSSHHNVYENNYDDHIEMENWAGHQGRELRLHHNLFLGNGLISHQSDDIRGPQYVYRNVAYFNDNQAPLKWTIIKSRAPNATEGIHYYHNLLWSSDSELFWEGQNSEHMSFRNNILIFERNLNHDVSTPLDANYNVLINDVDKALLYGSDGSYLGTDHTLIGFTDPTSLNFGIAIDSPVKGMGVAIADFNDSSGGAPDIGPFDAGVDPGSVWPRPRRTIYDTNLPDRWVSENATP